MLGSWPWPFRVTWRHRPSFTWPFNSQGPISYRHSIVTKSLSPAVYEIMGTKHIGVMTLTFQGHVTSLVTWPLDLGWAISYWWSFEVFISNGFRDIPPQTSCTHRQNANSSLCMRVSRDMYVKFKYIFQFLTPTLPIHYVTFIELWWRIRGVLSVTSNVNGQIERKISKFKNLQNFDLFGALEIRGYEKLRFYCKRHILAWMHVVWAILHQNRLGGLTSRGEPGKKSESFGLP